MPITVSPPNTNIGINLIFNHIVVWTVLHFQAPALQNKSVSRVCSQNCITTKIKYSNGFQLYRTLKS